MKFIRETLALMLLIAAASEVYAQVCTRPPDGDARVDGPSPDQLTYAEGDRVRYSCANPDHIIFGRASNFVWLRCRADGTWNKPFPCCEPRSCMSPPDGINTVQVLSADRVLVGTSYTYTCLCGLQTTDPVVTTCQADGTWDVAAPNCGGGGGGPCQPPWVLSGLGICYLVATAPAVNWPQARTNCIAGGGDLATPETNVLLADLAGVRAVASSDLWIGAGQLLVNGLDDEFIWLNTGNTVTQILTTDIVRRSLGREMLTFTFTPSSYTLFFQDESVFRGYICQK